MAKVSNRRATLGGERASFAEEYWTKQRALFNSNNQIEGLVLRPISLSPTESLNLCFVVVKPSPFQNPQMGQSLLIADSNGEGL